MLRVVVDQHAAHVKDDISDHRSLPMEGMEDLLRELKELGYGVYLLSNATLRQPEYFDRLPVSRYMDGRMVSAFHQLLKPHANGVQRLPQPWNIPVEHCSGDTNAIGSLYIGHGVVYEEALLRLKAKHFRQNAEMGSYLLWITAHKSHFINICSHHFVQ